MRDVKRRMRPLFAQQRVARSAENFLDGLLGEERCKTDWMRPKRPAMQETVASTGDLGPSHIY